MIRDEFKCLTCKAESNKLGCELGMEIYVVLLVHYLYVCFIYLSGGAHWPSLGLVVYTG